jgi:glycosyltransferase involved in cell wall biosynthesis
VTAVAEPVADFLRDQVGIPSRKLKTITTGVDVSRFSSAVPFTRSALDWRDDDVVIGCVARLEPEKGHAILLDAFRHVSARNRRVRLLLIGDGGERERLVSMAQAFGLNGSVRFLGIRSDIPELLRTCDMAVLASSQEGLPIALLEAMAAGKPVVATRVGSVPQVVQDGLTGLLVLPGDAAALAEALETLIADHQTRRRLAERAFELVGAHFSFDRTLKQYAEVFDAVLSRERS